MEEKLKKLRAWIYLRAPTETWAELGYDEKTVLTFGEERLKLVAFAIVVGAGRNEGEKRAIALTRELLAIGYGRAELTGTKRQFDLLLKSVMDLGKDQ